MSVTEPAMPSVQEWLYRPRASSFASRKSPFSVTFLVGWLVGCLFGYLVGRLVGCRLVGRSVGWLFGWLVGWFVGSRDIHNGWILSGQTAYIAFGSAKDRLT
jgi:uncharacterized membrane protein required for colicin V production